MDKVPFCNHRNDAKNGFVVKQPKYSFELKNKKRYIDIKKEH